MKSILVAVDFSDVTAEVVAQATRLASAFGVPLHLLHVAAPDPLFVGYEAGPQVVRDQRAQELREEHGRLQDMAADLERQGVPARALLLQGPTVQTILEQTAASGAGLIVIGSHGRGALYRALVGSVSEGVLRKATCPVVVVPGARKREEHETDL